MSDSPKKASVSQVIPQSGATSDGALRGSMFFGQYLLRKEIISVQQLTTAVAFTRIANDKLGTLAVRRKYLTDEQVDQIHAEQRICDLPFGEIAAQHGLLNSAQIEELLQTQREHHMRIGEALVALGYIDKELLSELLSDFAEVSREMREISLLPEAMREESVARYIFEYLPKAFLRVGDMMVKLGPGRVWTGSERYAFQVAISVSGTLVLEIGLGSDEKQAQGLAKGIHQSWNSEPEEPIIAAAFAEFAEGIRRTLQQFLYKEHPGAEVGAIQFGGLPSTGYSFDTFGAEGVGALIINKPT
jgi:hypothetical protein